MKTLSRILHANGQADLLRNLFISLGCVGVVVITLYILINSPA